MVWSIEGRAKNIKMGCRESGILSAWGDGKHKPQFVLDAHSPSQLSRINAAECGWSFYPSNASDVELDPNGEGLLQLVREAPDQTHISVQFFDDTPFVGFRIVVSPAQLDHIIGLFRTVLLGEKLRFVIIVDFAGFRAENAATLTPTASEFLSGKPCLTYDKMSLVIAQQIPDA